MVFDCTMTPRTALALLLALAASSAASAADIPLDGSKLQLADSPRPEGRRNLVALADPDVDLSAVDPRITGATVSLGPDAGPATVIDLPASGWSLTGNAPRIDFKYKSKTGAVRGARLIDGRSIRLTAKGPDAYALGGSPQGAVSVVVAIGGVRFCGAFGGTITRDDGQRFVARNAPAPPSCSAFGVTTTTSSTSTSTSSTTSTSTSTTTSTTRPYTLVQTYTNGCVPFNYLTLETLQTFASYEDAVAHCVVKCDSSNPRCVQIFVGYEGCSPKTGPYACLTGADDAEIPSKHWNAAEIQCALPSPPYPTCGEWYDLAPPP